MNRWGSSRVSREGWIILDPGIAWQINDIYNFSEDLLIGIATDIIKREAFHGGISYDMAELGDGGHTNNNNNNNNGKGGGEKKRQPRQFDKSEFWVEHILQKALDYFYQYGMCPFMRADHTHAIRESSTTGQEARVPSITPIGAATEDGASLDALSPSGSRRQKGGGGKNHTAIQRFIIPTIQSGNFLARTTKDGQVEVGFQLYEYGKKEAAPTPGVHVFVWPGRSPVPESPTPFRSLVYRLLPFQLNIRELWRNDMDASHTSAHPSLILVRERGSGGSGAGHGMDEETELHVYSDALALSGPSSMEHQRAARTDSEMVTRLQKQLAELREFSGDGVKRLGVDEHLIAAPIMRSQNWQTGNVYPVPSGHTTATAPVASREKDLILRCEWWQKLVASQFGVPPQLLDQRSTKSRDARQQQKGASSQAAAGQSESITLLRKTVQEARERMVTFFEDAYDRLFRRDETDRIAGKIIKGRQRIATLKEYDRHLEGRPLLEQLQQTMEQRHQEELKWMEEDRKLRTVINTVFNMALERTSRAWDTSKIRSLARQALESEKAEKSRLKKSVLPASKRLSIHWNQPILVDVTTLNWLREQGFIHDDVLRQIVLREVGLPEDTPKGISIEERMLQQLKQEEKTKSLKRGVADGQKSKAEKAKTNKKQKSK